MIFIGWDEFILDDQITKGHISVISHKFGSTHSRFQLVSLTTHFRVLDSPSHWLSGSAAFLSNMLNQSMTCAHCVLWDTMYSPGVTHMQLVYFLQFSIICSI